MTAVLTYPCLRKYQPYHRLEEILQLAASSLAQIRNWVAGFRMSAQRCRSALISSGFKSKLSHQVSQATAYEELCMCVAWAIGGAEELKIFDEFRRKFHMVHVRVETKAIVDAKFALKFALAPGWRAGDVRKFVPLTAGSPGFALAASWLCYFFDSGGARCRLHFHLHFSKTFPESRYGSGASLVQPCFLQTLRSRVNFTVPKTTFITTCAF
jgi:hypothetical protein